MFSCIFSRGGIFSEIAFNRLALMVLTRTKAIKALDVMVTTSVFENNLQRGLYFTFECK